MKTTKRLIAIFLSVIMVASIMIIPASAATYQASGLPIYYAPTDVYDLKTTNYSNGYNFVPGTESGTIISVNATLIHSLSAGLCKAGVCHYTGTAYSSDIAGTAISQHLISESGLRASLDKDRTYYAFARNMAGSGYISSGYVNITCS